VCDTLLDIASFLPYAVESPRACVRLPRYSAWQYGARVIFTLLLSASHLGMLPPHGVVAPPGQAGGEALARRLVLDVMDAGVAVTWGIPAAMSRKGHSCQLSHPSVEDKALKEGP
jgi:hypothetical protein